MYWLQLSFGQGQKCIVMLSCSLRGEMRKRPGRSAHTSVKAEFFCRTLRSVYTPTCDLDCHPQKTLEHRKQRLCLLSWAHLLLSLCCSPRASDLLAFESPTSAFLLELHLSVHGMVAAWSGEVWSWLRSLSVGPTLHQPGLIPTTKPQILRLPAAPFQAL